ncbi:MAG: hypothetical protein JXA10_07825 [Anaerolineae bacterium]|nr:hypothetical protein [Anaerolineae bacterium]
MKKRIFVPGLVLVFVLALTPLLVLAQDDIEFEEFVTEDEMLTLSYPSEWVHEADTGFFPTFMAGTTEHALAQMNEDVLMPDSGDIMLFVMVVPVDILAEAGLEPDNDLALAELTTLLSGMFLEPDDPDSDNQPEFAEAAEVELDDELVVGQIEFMDNYLHGVFMLRELDEALFVITLVGTPLDEFNENVVAIGEQTISSVAYAGTREDLLAAIMAGPQVEDAPEGAMAADLDGAALVAERCTICHTADRINNAEKDEAGWTATVDRMIGHGAQLNTAERDAVIAYLSGM